MVTERGFNYAVLRMIVMAMHNQGMHLKQPNLTFAHGNMGNQFIETAKHFDEFLADLEPGEVLFMVKESKLKADAEFLAGKQDRIEICHKFMRDVAAALALPQFSGMSDDAIIALIGSLRTDRDNANKELVQVAVKLGAVAAFEPGSDPQIDNPYGMGGALYDGADSMGLALEWYEAYQAAGRQAALKVKLDAIKTDAKLDKPAPAKKASKKRK